ncbi:hypothetical protein BJ875DRAFT_488420 [Amylocarpus encephaloides]|uniref:Protein kinase domain-containing protein n=1 Tax=Amylocarpus encephaloides TaxID=45428 RepID=A0A9P8C1J9_9HELO|nr:hypothetical protein BJ875DRAFT_488420 [Amylocarpus encephaloides]
MKADVFALGSLLYLLITGKEIFSDEADEEVEDCWYGGAFPEDVWGLKAAEFILHCWCPGYTESVNVPRRPAPSILNSRFYAFLDFLQVTGVTTPVVTLIVGPIIRAISLSYRRHHAKTNRPTAFPTSTNISLIECSTGRMGWKVRLLGIAGILLAIITGVVKYWVYRPKKKGLSFSPEVVKERLVVEWDRYVREAVEYNVVRGVRENA